MMFSNLKKSKIALFRQKILSGCLALFHLQFAAEYHVPKPSKAGLVSPGTNWTGSQLPKTTDLKERANFLLWTCSLFWAKPDLLIKDK